MIPTKTATPECVGMFHLQSKCTQYINKNNKKGKAKNTLIKERKEYVTIHEL